MKNDTLYTEIIPNLFNNLDSALPEFGFQRTAKGWHSTTGHKVDGSSGKDGKVYAYNDNIRLLWDATRGKKTIWDYVADRDGLSSTNEVFKRLAELSGHTLSNDSLTPEQLASIEAANRRAKLWEDANQFFMDCLSGIDNDFAKKAGADHVRHYLVTNRGYNANLIQLPTARRDPAQPKIEVGYVPGLYEMRDYLKNEKGYSIDEVTKLITDGRIGDTHRLAIPYRDPSGRIRGMVFRATAEIEPKYLYSAGLEKKDILFNLKAVTGQKDVVIVEGVLDALHATAQGLENVVAIGGSGGALSRQHIDNAIKYGARKITLLLDKDTAGESGTDKALELLLQFPKIRPYVAFVGEEEKDLDRLLTLEGGVDLAKVVIKEAVSGWAHLLERLINKYGVIQRERGYLLDKERDALQQDLTETAARLPKADGDQIISTALKEPAIRDLGISESTLLEIKETLRKIRLKEQRDREARELLAKAQQRIDNGQGEMALEMLRDESQRIKSADKENQFIGLSATTSEQQLMSRLRNKPISLESGYRFKDDEKGNPDPIVIPSGQISIVAGATSHGKTILLTNLALNLCRLYPDKHFHLFSYEQDQETYLINTLNTYIGDNDLAFRNRESISHYFKGLTRTTQRLAGETRTFSLWNAGKEQLFHQKRAEFFNDLIAKGRLKIHYVDYDSDTLIDAINYLLSTEPLGAVLVDYVQLINLPSERNKGLARQEEIKRMCQDFNQLANDTGLPLIFGAQFNRTVRNLAQMEAQDLGEAGDLERIANLIIALWNNRFTGSNHNASDKIKIEKIFGKGVVAPDPATWYVEALKRRDGKVGAWDIWKYDSNSGKVTSNL